MNITFITSEAYPFAKTGGLADYSYSLPKALAKLGHTVNLFLPRYYCVDKIKYNCSLIDMPLAVPHDDGIRWAGIYKSNYLDTINVYFIEHDVFFGRDGLYDYHGIPYGDNAERFIYFNRATLEALKQLAIVTDIIHCNDWQTALIPLFLKTHYAHESIFKNTKSVLTMHNAGYQGVFPKDVLYYMQLSDEYFVPERLAFYDKINFLKAGILYADCLTTVSKRYAQEIQYPDYGYDLAPIIKQNSSKLFGILNGVDYEQWNPEYDKFIPCNFSINDVSGKKKCKYALQDYFSLNKSDIPLLGCISRLTYQKGIDILIDALDWLLFDEPEVQFVLLGNGEQWLIDRFENLRKLYPDKVGVWWGYNEKLSHCIEAGCDFYVMPSRYEPSGLNQMYSMAYGTIPIVRATGGLDDSVIEFNTTELTGNGFKYKHNDIAELYSTIRYALKIYNNSNLMQQLIYNAMSFKRSWDDAAKEYEALYKNIK